MGFEADASTAGSSVRFQPPDPALRSISFHKRKCFAVFPDKNLYLEHSSPGKYDRPDHSAKVGQEAEELLRVVRRNSSAARQSTTIDTYATGRATSAREAEREISKRWTFGALGNWNESTLYVRGVSERWDEVCMPSERWSRGPPVKRRDGSGSGGVHHTVLMEA